MALSERLTLSELCGRISWALKEEFPRSVWVVAEIGEISRSRGGHLCLTLIERDEDRTVARLGSWIWADNLDIVEDFESAAGQELSVGISVLLRAEARFHSLYGLSLTIRQIDPAYTVGVLASKKAETLERLRREGLLDRNRQLGMPIVPQRIAVVSSRVSAGQGDFIVHLDQNPFGYRFSYARFETAVQGDEAETSIAQALGQVARMASLFDAAVVLRGGGSQLDLGCFDAYQVARAIALCPIPVLTGIGHEKDDTVADLAAHSRLKTPTAVAGFLIDRVREFEDRLEMLGREACDGVRSRLRSEQLCLSILGHRSAAAGRKSIAACDTVLHAAAIRMALGARRSLGAGTEASERQPSLLRRATEQVVGLAAGHLTDSTAGLGRAARSGIAMVQRRLEVEERAVRILDPVNTLRRGYSVTRLNGRAVRHIAEVAAGSRLETQVADGKIDSTVDVIRANGPGDQL